MKPGMKTMFSMEWIMTKNMMHTFRLLKMTQKILQSETIQVKRPDRIFLLSIKQGQYEYDNLMKIAEEQIQLIEDVGNTSTLQEAPEISQIENLLINIKKKLYQDSKWQ